MTDLRQRWSTSVDGASLAVYRIVFGLLMFVGAARFWRNGWIHELYIQPDLHFTYYGFEWIRPLPGAGMYVVFGVIAAAALFVAVGLFYRAAIVVFFVVFTYVELLDATNYLNHYYLVSLIALLAIFLPLHRAWSVDAARKRWSPEVPAWALDTLRAQVGLVYFFAGVAKLDSEWLFDAQPLSIWFAANADVAVIGPLLAQPWVAYVASWSAAAFDLTVVFWLLHPRTRRVAFAVLVVFHVVTAKLFFLGLFPWLMIANATLFFAPSWPRREARATVRPTRAPPAILAVYFAVQLLLPLRHLVYPGDAGRTEEGGRFAWRVMLKEKAGFVVYHVTDDSGRAWEAYPREFLTPIQQKMLPVEPEMIRQLARHIRGVYEARGLTGVEVRAEAYVSVNGRPSEPLVDPDVDLSAATDGVAPRPWILR